MFYVYVIKSKRDNKCYIGSTSDLKRRFSEHNSELALSTAPRKPFQLIYYEAYRSEKDTRLREARLKQYKRVYNQLKQRIIESLKT